MCSLAGPSNNHFYSCLPASASASSICLGRRALTPRVTFRRVVAPLRGPGRSPVLPFACCVGSLRSVGRCGRCSCGCRFRVRALPPPPPPRLCPRPSLSLGLPLLLRLSSATVCNPQGLAVAIQGVYVLVHVAPVVSLRGRDRGYFPFVRVPAVGSGGTLAAVCPSPSLYCCCSTWGPRRPGVLLCRCGCLLWCIWRAGGGGFGMRPWCDDLVCSGRRLLANRHSLPFPWTLSLRVVPISFSPPCDLPLPPCPNCPSPLPFPFPWPFPP